MQMMYNIFFLYVCNMYIYMCFFPINNNNDNDGDDDDDKLR